VVTAGQPLGSSFLGHPGAFYRRVLASGDAAQVSVARNR